MTLDYSKISAVILSGGKSVRMETDKCNLLFRNNTFIDYQVKKMRNIGILDIVASGYRGRVESAFVVKDELLKGPLSGIYYGLSNINNDRAVILSVDVPLVKEDNIRQLIACSFEKNVDVVLLSHKNKIEPLIGVYKKVVKERIIDILNKDNYSVMKLIDLCSSYVMEVDDLDIYFWNINYKEDYNKLLALDSIGGI